MKTPELLAPAGNLEKLKTAVHYGADAVYLGGRQYSLRAHATNFNDEEIGDAVSYAHAHGAKAYVTVNVFAHNDDLAGLPEYLLLLLNAGADAIIVSDPGILSIAQQAVPDLPVHLSTQANVTNVQSARFWLNQGVKRLNLARELSLQEIGEFRRAVSAEIELFVHGALCISYSGRCLLSLYLTGRDANLGDCAHPCRYLYRLEEEKRPGQFFPVEEDDRGTYIFSSKDLCLLHRLPGLINAGADSLKIEGRMKSVYYVGAIVRLYRAALDYFSSLPESIPQKDGYPELPRSFQEELEKIGSRGYTENFLDTPPEQGDMLYEGAQVRQEYAPVGIVRQEKTALIEVRNPLNTGDRIEYLDKGLVNRPCVITEIRNQGGEILTRANPNSLVHLQTDPPPSDWKINGLLRKENSP